MLRPYIDIYLMDVKYGDDHTAARLCRVRDYWDTTRQAVSWCWETAGALREDADGAAAGLIVRHPWCCPACSPTPSRCWSSSPASHGRYRLA